MDLSVAGISCLWKLYVRCFLGWDGICQSWDKDLTAMPNDLQIRTPDFFKYVEHTFILFYTINTHTTRQNRKYVNNWKSLKKSDNAVEAASIGWAILSHIGYGIYIFCFEVKSAHANAESNQKMETAAPPKSRISQKTTATRKYCPRLVFAGKPRSFFHRRWKLSF